MVKRRVSCRVASWGSTCLHILTIRSSEMPVTVDGTGSFFLSSKSGRQRIAQQTVLASLLWCRLKRDVMNERETCTTTSSSRLRLPQDQKRVEDKRFSQCLARLVWRTANAVRSDERALYTLCKYLRETNSPLILKREH